MGWRYTNRGLSQESAVGAALAGLGVMMLAFGVWHFRWNRELAELHSSGLSPARYREMAMPAVFGLTVLACGIAIIYMARRRRRA